MIFRDVLREADPTLLLYSPSSAQGERESVLKALLPELDSGNLVPFWFTFSPFGDDDGSFEESSVPSFAHCGFYRVGPFFAEWRDQFPDAARRSGFPRPGFRGFQASGSGAGDRAAA